MDYFAFLLFMFGSGLLIAVLLLTEMALHHKMASERAIMIADCRPSMRYGTAKFVDAVNSAVLRNAKFVDATNEYVWRTEWCRFLSNGIDSPLH